MSEVSELLPQHGEEPQHVTDSSGVSVAYLGVPWITYTVIAFCAVIFAYLNLAKGTRSYDGFTAKLVPSCVAIWSGAYWGLVTSAFVHFDLWHILFNMWWAKDFGTVLEATMGRSRYLGFIIGAAVIGSGLELAISSSTGIGFSGVVYAMFGYGLIGRQADARLQRIVNKQTIQWLLGWLILCIVLTVAKVWHIANAAHVGGFFFGCLMGSAFGARRRIKASLAGLAALLVAAVLPAVYMPWSPYWKQRDTYAEYATAPQKAVAGDREAQFLYGQMLIQQKEKKAEAISWLSKSAGQGYLPSMDLLAWLLATDSDASLRDGAEATKWAERMCKEDGWKTTAYIDTLAATYAELGRWEEAVATQRIAISKLTDADAKTKASYESRLQKYLKQEKVRE